MKIIAVANQKGGVGKTTTAVNLAASLAVAEQRTLLIDLDPQGNATTAFGFDKQALGAEGEHATIYRTLVDGLPLESCIYETDLSHLSLAPATTDLAGAEIELVTAVAREQRLKQALAALSEDSDLDYDYVLIDCPPSLGLLTLNALTAAQSVLIPLQCEFFALEGVSHLMATIELVKTHLNPALSLEGIVLTMFDRRNKLSFQVQDEVRSYFGAEVFDTKIPRNVRLSESPSFGKPAILYDVAAPGTRAYLELATELMTRNAPHYLQVGAA